jgi:hypothetical protein
MVQMNLNQTYQRYFRGEIVAWKQITLVSCYLTPYFEYGGLARNNFHIHFGDADDLGPAGIRVSWVMHEAGYFFARLGVAHDNNGAVGIRTVVFDGDSVGHLGDGIRHRPLSLCSLESQLVTVADFLLINVNVRMVTQPLLA